MSGTAERGPAGHDVGGRGVGGRDARGRDGGGRDGGGRGETASQEGIRLQKVLASAGVGSRRHNEELIDAGRVRVDGKVVREQGRRVDPETAVIEVDGERVVTRTGLVHLALNKPRGVVSTMSDPEDRPTISDLLTEFGASAGLFHVGRLDVDSEGLLLVTNNGDLAHRLTHPSYQVPKTYQVQINGPLRKETMRRLHTRVELSDGPVRVDSARIIDQVGSQILLEIVLHEGRNRIVRRMMEEVGHPVVRLLRTEFGAVHLGTLRSGRARHLTLHEVGALHSMVGL
ncbi:pseudouridine synthase [Pseudofrankia inefficax]|uniref:Pseudouridine synthase n=1 Tax=Pseudofrankia inefficax (strain DSM 45817 / CECT 9037 / DDB 130130 / EuI1c) TaxID=298654 RepID=E3JAA4_PSEI1|nr:pseudouridine synthase [Pseudofrankia inefficax]